MVEEKNMNVYIVTVEDAFGLGRASVHSTYAKAKAAIKDWMAGSTLPWEDQRDSRSGFAFWSAGRHHNLWICKEKVQ